MRTLLLIIVALLGSWVPTAGSAQKHRFAGETTYHGMADASGAVAVSSNRFVTASDEDNVLRVYDSEHGGLPLSQLDMNSFLGVSGHSLEADLEAAARIGHRIFWIGSHARNKDGKLRENRHRFFATDFQVTPTGIELKPVGVPCVTLIEQLEADKRFAGLGLERGSLLMPKALGALNIEGLAATPEGHLLIGFRSPLPGGKALVLPLLNPDDVVAGKAARFGDPLLLDLDGLGIRDMAWDERSKSWLISGGGSSGNRNERFAFFRWDGPGRQPEKWKVRHIGNLHPEAIIIYPESGLNRVQILSDDGRRKVDGVEEKSLPDPSQRSFRSVWLVK